MPENSYLIAAVLVMALVTFALRAAPFALLRKHGQSPVLQYLRTSLPPGIMVILVVYSIQAVDFTRAPYGAPALAGIGACAATYHWSKSPLAAIIAGVGVNMALLHFL